MSAAVIERARKAVTSHDGSDWVGRVGWMARAVVYLVLSLLVVQVALHRSTGGEKADQKGALQAVAQRPFGSALMVILALGFLFFAAGRVIEILTNNDDGAKRWAKITSRAASAITQLAFAGLAITFVGGGHSQGKGPTANALDWPFGRWIVGAIGLGFAAVGVGSAVQGIRQTFMHRLEDHEMSASEERTARILGTVGLSSRGVTFALAGWFVVDAARSYDPEKTSGLDAALRSLAGQSWGSPALLAIAAGLVCFAAYCGFMGRYRDLSA